MRAIQIDPAKIPSKGLLKKKFKASTKLVGCGAAASGITAGIFTITDFVLTAGLGSLMMYAMIGAIGPLQAPILATNKTYEYTKANQIIETKVFNSFIFIELQKEIIKTYDDEKLTPQEASEKLHELLGFTQALEPKLTVIDKDGNKIDEPVYYMTRELPKGSKEDPLKYAIDSRGRPAKRTEPKIEAFKL